mgnify:CR=1 FL=1
MAEFHSVVVPMYCEADVAEQFIDRTTAVLDGLGSWELIVVDDGSTDATFDIVKARAQSDPRIKIIRLARNFGHQAATSAGIHHASGDTVTVIDADLQDPPEGIAELVQAWRDGAEIVYATRTARRGESLFKRWSAAAYYRVFQALSSTSAPLDSGDFRLMGRTATRAFCEMNERNRYVRGMVGWIGMPSARVNYARDPRAAGETKYPLRKMIALAADGLFSFSLVPLRIAVWFGVFSALLGFAIGLWAFIQRMSGGAVIPGWASTMVAILFMGGVQLLTVGVMGEYIGRIYDEVRRRPLYLIGETVGELPTVTTAR